MFYDNVMLCFLFSCTTSSLEGFNCFMFFLKELIETLTFYHKHHTNHYKDYFVHSYKYYLDRLSKLESSLAFELLVQSLLLALSTQSSELVHIPEREVTLSYYNYKENPCDFTTHQGRFRSRN